MLFRGNKYNAVVVGAGSIGGGTKPHKYDSPTSKDILSISHAFYAHPQTDLIGVVDINVDNRCSSEIKWKTNSYCDIRFIDKRIDIVAVCIPTEFHYDYFSKLNLNCKGIIAEKPFTDSIEKANSIKREYEAKKIPIAVDYIRRYEKNHQMLKTKFDNQEFGKIYHCTLTYTRGLVHEACHFIDLCNWWFGKCLGGERLQIKPNSRQYKVIIDRDELDPTYAVHLTYRKCPHVFLRPSDGLIYKIFDIEIHTEKGIIKITEFGSTIEFYHRTLENKYHGNFDVIKSKPHRIKTDMGHALYNLVDNVVKKIEDKEDLICVPQDAIEVYKVYEMLEK